MKNARDLGRTAFQMLIVVLSIKPSRAHSIGKVGFQLSAYLSRPVLYDECTSIVISLANHEVLAYRGELLQLLELHFTFTG
jgi:hypothetical protein